MNSIDAYREDSKGKTVFFDTIYEWKPLNHEKLYYQYESVYSFNLKKMYLCLHFSYVQMALQSIFYLAKWCSFIWNVLIQVDIFYVQQNTLISPECFSNGRVYDYRMISIRVCIW